MRVKAVFAFVVLAASLSAFAGAAITLSPSELHASPGRYVGQRVSVSGVVRGSTTVAGRRPYTTYQLCDMQACVNVVQFGAGSVTSGATQTVTGTMQRSVFTPKHHIQNAILIGKP
jgi:hypothetical protein